MVHRNIVVVVVKGAQLSCSGEFAYERMYDVQLSLRSGPMQKNQMPSQYPKSSKKM
jgi:hypothetical protein